MDFELFFSDITMLEANGEYEDVCRLMKEEYSTGLVTSLPVKDWVIASGVTIQSSFGFGSLQCDFYHDSKIVITDYTPSLKDLHCPDIRCLRYWAEQFGWSRIEPTEAVVDHMREFWMNQWETYVIDSDVLDKRHGVRSDMNFVDTSDDDDDIDD